MDKFNNKVYNLVKKGKGVIYLTPMVAPAYPTIKPTPKDQTNNKSARDIRNTYGVSTSTGKRLVDLFREGK